MNRYKTYATLGKILNLDSSPLIRDMVIQEFTKINFSWQEFVSIADKHLVLQALYPKIKSNHLEEFLPSEVLDHLKNIFELSQERNYNIIGQASSIARILRNEGISPLFMKGVGNILDGLYKNPGERILFDIDLLVPEGQFNEAAQILLANDYLHSNPLLKLEIQDEKHYPILYKKGEAVSVELHKKPSSTKLEKIINTTLVFNSSKTPDHFKDCLVMSDEHKLIHSFVHSQIDHRGHIFAKEYLRNLYDVRLLSGRIIPEQVFAEFPSIAQKSIDYMDIYYAVFEPHPGMRKIKSNKLPIFKFRYYLNIRFRFFGLINLILIRMYLGYIVKPLKAINNKEMRTKMLKNLNTLQWYKKHLNFYKRILKSK